MAQLVKIIVLISLTFSPIHAEKNKTDYGKRAFTKPTHQIIDQDSVTIEQYKENLNMFKRDICPLGKNQDLTAKKKIVIRKIKTISKKEPEKVEVKTIPLQRYLDKIQVMAISNGKYFMVKSRKFHIGETIPLTRGISIKVDSITENRINVHNIKNKEKASINIKKKSL